MALNLLSDSRTFFSSDHVRQFFLNIESSEMYWNMTPSSGLNSPTELILEAWEKELVTLVSFSWAFFDEF